MQVMDAACCGLLSRSAAITFQFMGKANRPPKYMFDGNKEALFCC